MRRISWRSPRILIPAAVLAVIGMVVGAALFQPWRLFVDERVDEALDVAPATAAPSRPGSDDATPTATSPTATGPTRTGNRAEPVVLRTGRLISHEHATSGTVTIIGRPDGSRVLRIEDLDTSNGPDLRVWLSSAPVIEGSDGWFVFDDHDYVELGRLKANLGNQNYEIPGSADLDRLTSVSIWCKRFRVSFGAASLTAP